MIVQFLFSHWYSPRPRGEILSEYRSCIRRPSSVFRFDKDPSTPTHQHAAQRQQLIAGNGLETVRQWICVEDELRRALSVTETRLLSQICNKTAVLSRKGFEIDRKQTVVWFRMRSINVSYDPFWTFPINIKSSLTLRWIICHIWTMWRNISFTPCTIQTNLALCVYFNGCYGYNQKPPQHIPTCLMCYIITLFLLQLPQTCFHVDVVLDGLQHCDTFKLHLRFWASTCLSLSSSRREVKSLILSFGN